MIINGTKCENASSSMSIFIDSHVVGSPPFLCIELVGESTTIDMAGHAFEVKPRIHMMAPLPVRDWRMLDGLTVDMTFPGMTCLAWFTNPQMVDMESFKCIIRNRSGRVFSVEIAATLACYDLLEFGAQVSISAFENFTLNSISVGVPGSSTSPVEDASQLLARHLDLDSVSLPTLHCLRDIDQVNILAYEVHFQTNSGTTADY